MTNTERFLVTDRVGGFERGAHLRRPDSAKLFLPLYAVGLFGSVLFVLCFFGAVDVTAALPTAVLITLTASPVIAAVAIQETIFSRPFNWWLPTFLFITAPGPPSFNSTLGRCD